MKRTMGFYFLLSMLALSCQGIFVKRDSDISQTRKLSESESANLAREEIESIVGAKRAQVYWLTMKDGNLIFGITYATALKPASQSDTFLDQFNQVALIASKYYNQTSTQAVSIIVMAEDIDFPTSDYYPPLRQVIIENEDVAAWAAGKTTDAKFIESWFVTPVEVFPTPE
jgi:hypothetical protein